MENLCKKASYKLWALQRIKNEISHNKTHASSFVNNQFNYYRCSVSENQKLDWKMFIKEH